ncbi:MAG: hypothetical protein J6C28_00440 [Bacilli bacterium]|nr:hypothetical protein [Bacilli bacterium]
MTRKKLKILGIVLAFLLCFPLHFVYDKFPSFITSIFAPINESIWEHMKILFGSIIISGVIQKIIVLKKKLDFNNICFSNFIGAISSIPIFLIVFLPIYIIIGENFPVTIFIMFITIVLAEIIAYKIMNKDNLGFENITIILVIIVYVIFTILSYYPIKSGIFIDPISKTCGISKEKL